MHVLLSYSSYIPSYQGKFNLSIIAYFQITDDCQSTPVVETPKHTLEASADQQVQTRKVNIIEILNFAPILYQFGWPGI